MPSPGEWLGNQASNLAKDWLVDLAGKVGQSAELMMQKTATFWVTGVPSPQLTQTTASNPYAPSDTVAYIWEHLSFYVSALAVFSIIIAAIKIAWEGNGRPARDLLQSLLTWVVVSSAGVATISLLTTASDAAASYILQDAMKDPSGNPTDFQTAFGAIFLNPTPTGPNAVAIIALMFLVFLASLAQIALLVVRGAMLFLLAGMLPLAAAATNTEMGRTWLKKTVAWTIAFLLYKPVAAVIYATAFLLTREGGSFTSSDALVKLATGLTLCILALFALPALMRFTAPAVAAAAGGGGGGAGLAALGALASGARPFFSGKGGGGGGKPPTPPPPPGPKSEQKDGPQGGTLPPGGKTGGGDGGGKPGGPAGTGGAVSKAPTPGAVAAGIADGLKKASEGANSAVSNAAGEESKGASASKPKPAPAKPGGNPGGGPTGGQSGKTPPPPSVPPGPPPSNKPPGGDGPSGAPKGKQTPPNNSGGPTGGKRQ
jgi:type IV secretion system protein TrbL